MRFTLLAASAAICQFASVSAQYYSDDDSNIETYGESDGTSTLFWTVTQYVISTTETYDLTTRTMTYDAEATMVPEYTPPADASVIDSITIDDYYSDYRLVQMTLDSAVSVPDSMIQTDDSYDSDQYTYYIVLQSFTAPASCDTTFTWVLPYSTRLPTEVRNEVTPTSTHITTGYWSYTGTYLYVPESQIPTIAPPAQYSAYIARCSTPYSGYQVDESGVSMSTSRASSTSYSSGDSSDDDTSQLTKEIQEEIGRSAAFWKVCRAPRSQDEQDTIDGNTGYDGLCLNLKPWVIAIAVIFPLLFVFGFAESFFWHYRLMSGCWALRLGTISWILICPWVALYTRISRDVSDTEKEYLLAKRKDMTFGQMAGHWLKWGFAWEHPLSQLSAEEKQSLTVAQSEPVADVPATREAVAPNAAQSPSIETPVSPVSEDTGPSSSRAVQDDEISPVAPGPSAH